MTFFESLEVNIKDPQSGNDHIAIPEVYKSLAYASVLYDIRFKTVHASNFFQHAHLTCCLFKITCNSFNFLADEVSSTCGNVLIVISTKIISVKTLANNTNNSMKSTCVIRKLTFSELLVTGWHFLCTLTSIFILLNLDKVTMSIITISTIIYGLLYSIAMSIDDKMYLHLIKVACMCSI